jgi:hypothetical protein
MSVNKNVLISYHFYTILQQRMYDAKHRTLMEIFGFILKAGRLGSSKPEQANLLAKKECQKWTDNCQADRQIGWLAGWLADRQMEATHTGM